MGNERHERWRERAIQVERPACTFAVWDSARHVKDEKEDNGWVQGFEAGKMDRDKSCRAQWAVLRTLFLILRPMGRHKKVLNEEMP